MTLKLSIITPSLNSADTIERAIQSVLAQKVDNFEHIIVDGGSEDETMEILRRYPHLKWVSEPDRGKVHAMNKGFARASGDIIGYLNARDYYHDGAFDAVLPFFARGSEIVMGKVSVWSLKDGERTHKCKQVCATSGGEAEYTTSRRAKPQNAAINEQQAHPTGTGQQARNLRVEKTEKFSQWLCDPATDFASMLRHWKPNAYCSSPVGYFYRREVQQSVPLRQETGAKYDLAFLLEVSLRYAITKIDRLLGVNNQDPLSQTAREQLLPAYWQAENFAFVDRLAEYLPAAEHEKYALERARGYQWRRHCAVRKAFALGLEEELLARGEVIMLPQGEKESIASRCGFVEHNRLCTRGDWIVPILTMGKVASKSICFTLESIDEATFPVQVYHIHQMNEVFIKGALPHNIPRSTHLAVGASLKTILDYYGRNLIWKFITGVREPLSFGLSMYYQANPHRTTDDMEEAALFVIKAVSTYGSYIANQYDKVIGIRILEYPFDYEKKYTIIQEGNKQVLIYRLEDLPQIFFAAMEEYLGIGGLNLLQLNVGTEKKYGQAYKEAREQLRFKRSFLDKVYSMREVRHFYSEEEIAGFYQKWQE